MATETVTSTNAGHIRPPDSVRIWVSSAIEADFIARGVFPQLRHGNHDEIRSGIAMHWCDLSFAAKVVLDAASRRPSVAGPLRAAYGALIRNTQREIEEAKSRPGWLAGSEPKPLPGYCQANRFLCTRSQLSLMGMPEGMKLPGDDGGPAKKANFMDARGQIIGITRAEFAWPGTFLASVKLSDRARREKEETDAKANQENQKVRLIDSLPDSKNDFRKDISLRLLTASARIVTDMEASQGYRFSEEAVEDFKALARGMYKILKEGAVVGQSREEVKRQHLIGRAKQDTGLQTFLRLVHSSSGSR